MKIKLDENLPATLVPLLAAQGHDADSVLQQGLAGADDMAIWNAAQQAGRFLVTQDLDFSDRRKFRPGTRCGLLLIRLHNPSRQALSDRVQTLFLAEDVETWSGCLVVATDIKTRVRRPSGT